MMKRAAVLLLLFVRTTSTISMSVTPITTSPSQATSLSLGGNSLRTLVQEAALHDQDAAALDVKGVLWTEHVNLVVGSKPLAQYFYLDVLGFTADAGKSFHVNLGQQQFHLAENGEPAQRVAGSMGLTIPSLETVRRRLEEAHETLKDTKFQILSDEAKCVTVSCPWGNVLHLYGADQDDVAGDACSDKKMVNLHLPQAAYGSSRMAVRGNPGIRYVEIACPVKTAPAIAKFYRELLHCTVLETTASTTVVCVGPGVHFCFVETENLSSEASQAMEGVHICIYAQDFEALYNRLKERNLIWTNPRFTHLDSCDTWEEARDSRTLRFKDVIDLDTGEKILELEHETRPLRHGQYLKVPKYEPK